MMKIYYIVNARMPTEKAHGFQISKMCESFARNSSEVTLILPKRRNNIKQDLFSFYGLKRNFNVIYVPVLDLVFLGKLGFFIESFSFALYIKLFVHIPKEIIIFSRDYISSFFLSSLKNKMIIEIHDEVKKNFIWNSVLKRVDFIISTNKLKKDKIIFDFKIEERKIFVFPNGVDLEDYQNLPDKNILRNKLNLPKDKFLISYVGKFKTMGEEKGLEEIILSLKFLPDNVVGVFVGANLGEAEAYKNILGRGGLSFDRAIFIEFTPKKEIPKYLKAMDILLMPFPKTRHYEFAMSPIKMFEYMASGVPIIASDLPSVKEILNDSNAHFFSPGSVELLSEKIKEVLANYEEALKKALRAKELVSRYTWLNRAREVLNFIGNKI